MHELIDACTTQLPEKIPLVDLHLHTTWTDGALGVGGMHDAAISVGMTAIAFTEHARQNSGDWFPNFAAEVRALPQERCRSIVGVEVKIIDFDGSIDISDAVRRECDLVMASVHRFPGEANIDKNAPLPMPPEEAIETEFRLSQAALKAGGIDILGHPFGMSIRRFGAVPPREKIEALVRLCAIHNVAFEINARYHPDPWDLIALCVAARAPISLGSDAHAGSGIGAIHRRLRENRS